MPDAQFLTREQFFHAGKAEALPPVPALRKQFVAADVCAAGEGDRPPLTFVISTESVDRDGDSIKVDGWDLANFRKNPVVQWAHDYRQLPIARATEVAIRDGKLHATAEFTTPDLHPLGDTVYRMLRAGFLNATSVGFVPRKWSWVDEPGRQLGIDFEEQELLEFSVVPVPANPEALIEAGKKGIDIAPLREWANQVLKDLADPTLKDRMQVLKFSHARRRHALRILELT